MNIWYFDCDRQFNQLLFDRAICIQLAIIWIITVLINSICFISLQFFPSVYFVHFFISWNIFNIQSRRTFILAKRINGMSKTNTEFEKKSVFLFGALNTRVILTTRFTHTTLTHTYFIFFVHNLPATGVWIIGCQSKRKFDTKYASDELDHETNKECNITYIRYKCMEKNELSIRAISHLYYLFIRHTLIV